MKPKIIEKIRDFVGEISLEELVENDNLMHLAADILVYARNLERRHAF